MLNWKHVHCICGKLTFTDKIWLGFNLHQKNSQRHYIFDHGSMNTTQNHCSTPFADGDTCDFSFIWKETTHSIWSMAVTEKEVQYSSVSALSIKVNRTK